MHSSRMRNARLLTLCLLGEGVVHPLVGGGASTGEGASRGGASGGVQSEGVHPGWTPRCKQTDACENITFQQLHLWAVKKESIRVLCVPCACRPYVFVGQHHISTIRGDRSSSEQFFTGIQWWPLDVSSRRPDVQDGGGGSLPCDWPIPWCM